MPGCYNSFRFPEEPPTFLRFGQKTYSIVCVRDEQNRWVYRIHKLDVPPTFIDLGAADTKEEMRRRLFVDGFATASIHETRFCWALVKRGLMIQTFKES